MAVRMAHNPRLKEVADLVGVTLIDVLQNKSLANLSLMSSIVRFCVDLFFGCGGCFFVVGIGLLCCEAAFLILFLKILTFFLGVDQNSFSTQKRQFSGVLKITLFVILSLPLFLSPLSSVLPLVYFSFDSLFPILFLLCSYFFWK